MLGSSRVAAQLAASREGLGSMSERYKQVIKQGVPSNAHKASCFIRLASHPANLVLLQSDLDNVDLKSNGEVPLSWTRA
jgi:hypothetical protein